LSIKYNGEEPVEKTEKREDTAEHKPKMFLSKNIHDKLGLRKIVIFLKNTLTKYLKSGPSADF
jgi:hypothetical protein